MQLLAYACYADRAEDPALVACWRASAQAMQRTPAPVRCQLCGTESTQRLASHDTREGLACPGCGLNARCRAGFELLHQAMPRVDRLYLTEQASPAFAWAQRHYPEACGSEHEPSADKRAVLRAHLASLGGSGPIQYQDATALTFADGTFDAVVSFDVLEHTPDYPAALREFARVLRKGGVLVATFPFIDQADTLVRARVVDGAIEHLCPPEYHGDPINGEALCYYHFGWNILDVTRRAGFKFARMVMPWAPEHGVHYGCWTLVARR